MGQKKDKSKNKEKLPIPYSQQERKDKMFKIKMQLIQLDMEHVLTDENKKAIDEFIKTGKEYNVSVDLPQFSRTMDIVLINDKRKQMGINFKFYKIRIPDEDNEKNPINKLNILQEEILQAQMLNSQ